VPADLRTLRLRPESLVSLGIEKRAGKRLGRPIRPIRPMGRQRVEGRWR
jgi:hypothetical protein